MVTKNTNPFVLPGFGQSGEMATNPMLASMDMMRKAWEGLASASGLDQSLAVPGASPEDLERRIADLRAVENWLRMNLSMLGSTIQALEVQRSTLATLQAFVASAGGGASSQPTTQSPLDVALGIRRGAGVSPSADSSGLFGDTAATPAAQSERAASKDAGAADAPAAPATDNDTRTSGQPDAAASKSGPADSVMQSWWDMLQTQFDNLASATAASLQGTEAMQDAAAEVQKKAVESTREAAEALKKSIVASTAPVKKTVAKKTAVRKTTTKTTPKTAVKKAAVKKTAVRKSSRKTAGAASTTSTATAVPATEASAAKTAVKKAPVPKTAAKKSPVKKSAAKKTAGSGSRAASKS